MRTRLRLLWLSPAFRWGLVVLVLLAAGAVAFWPRDSGRSTAAAPPVAAAPSTAASAAPSAGAGDPAAGGQPCPAAAAGRGGLLRGLAAQCLGDGQPVDAAAVLNGRAGRPTLVNVWASWCPPCREELPVLQRYAGTAGALRVVTVQIADDKPDAARALLRRLNVTLPAIRDDGTRVERALRVPYGLPASYLVHPDGSSTFVASPRVFGSVADVRDAVARYGRG